MHWMRERMAALFSVIKKIFIILGGFITLLANIKVTGNEMRKRDKEGEEE